MARELPARFGITPHATRRIATRQILLGFALCLLGIFIAIEGSAFGATTALLVLGAYFLTFGFHTRSTGGAAQVVNKAFNLASVGQLRDAEELLDFAEATSRTRYIQRVIDLQRSMLAMRRGELDVALRRADSAIEKRPSILAGHVEHANIMAAHGIRAVLRASMGDRDGARADVELVRGSPYAVPDTLARAELAVALLLERAGDKDALRGHLNQARRLLIEHTHPRDRAIVRAYQRMLKAASTTIYRTSAEREQPPSEEPALRDWVAKIAPGAAPFIRSLSAGSGSGKSVAAGDAEGVEPEARRAAEGRSQPTKSLSKGRVARLFVIYALCVGVLLAIWELLAPEEGSTLDARAFASRGVDPMTTFMQSASVFFGLLTAFVIARTGVSLIRARRNARSLLTSLSAAARGEEDRASRALTVQSKGAPYLVAAQAHLALAELAERRADLPAALAACEAGLGRLRTSVAQAVAHDILLPSLLAERAFLFAAMDRSADARAEVALLAERHPSFPYLSKARLRVSLVERARKGDIQGAARLAEEITDLPLGARDELLADLARATANPETAGAGEVARLREELRVDAVSRRWMEVVAPAALAAFTRVEHEAEEAERDARAEAEAKAEAEAEMSAEVEAERGVSVAR